MILNKHHQNVGNKSMKSWNNSLKTIKNTHNQRKFMAKIRLLLIKKK